MKKAQVQGQVLMMILTLMVLSFIVLFGGRIVSGITKQGSQINYIKFKTTIQNSIDSITQEYKSKKEFDLIIPSEYSKICFIDLSKEPAPEMKVLYPVIYNYWFSFRGMTDSKVTRNVFLVAKQAEASFFVDKITINPPGYLCIVEKRSKVNFWAEGLGNKARITSE